MTIRHLKIFIAVYETASFTKAGQRIHLAQPSVSLAIHELEEQYGVSLFDRIKHSIYPTEYGERLYDYATHIISLVDEMENSIKNKETQTIMRIGSSITIGNAILPLLIQQFQKLYPQMEIEVSISNSNTIEHQILQNTIDFALIETEPEQHNISSIPFMSDHLCTIAHRKHPLVDTPQIALDKLASYPFLMREHGSSVRELVESVFLMHQMQIKPAWVSSSTQALLQAVEHDLGITTLPYQFVKEKIAKKEIAELDVPQLRVNRRYNIIYYKDKYFAKPTLDFFEQCIAYGKKSL